MEAALLVEEIFPELTVNGSENTLSVLRRLLFQNEELERDSTDSFSTSLTILASGCTPMLLLTTRMA